MKTLLEHNSLLRALQAKKDETAHLTGIACNNCGAELFFENPNRFNTSNPPTRWVVCPECNNRDLMQ